MIKFLDSSVFESPAQTLVNTVNTVGVMGKGIAKEFKKRYPAMFKEYKALCSSNTLNIGNLHIWRSDNRWVLNFPTKTTWRAPSKISYVEAGLIKFAQKHKELGISSVSFPPLGCGNGGLKWSEVRPMMEHYLSNLDIDVYIHDVQVNKSHVPEHVEHSQPVNFEKFSEDIRFYCEIISRKMFNNKEKSDLHFFCNDLEFLDDVWHHLRKGLLLEEFVREQSGGQYLVDVLKEIPYVERVNIRKNADSNIATIAYFLDPEVENAFEVKDNSSNSEQQCLFPLN